MWWRLKRSEFEQQKGKGNRQAMKDIVESGEIPGIMVYHHNRPVGWCSVAPREQFQRLERSRILKPLDDLPVWSVVCFFIDRGFRNQGISVKLLFAALDYVRQQGGKIVEGYPVEPKKDRTQDVFASAGLASAFRKAGFVELFRHSETRPIMRFYIE